MIYSTTTLAERFTARGVHATAGTIRELIRGGIIEARRNARGEAEFNEREADLFEQLRSRCVLRPTTIQSGKDFSRTRARIMIRRFCTWSIAYTCRAHTLSGSVPSLSNRFFGHSGSGHGLANC
jgi:hypothetical protein